MACSTNYYNAFKELPYFNVDIVRTHGQFNNSLESQLPTKKASRKTF